jgi:exodeoxyribonuclease-5
MMQLDEVQARVVESIISDLEQGKKIITLGGYAGTGKTTLIKYLVSVLDGWDVAAFTGKAVSVLKKKGVQANTIHQTIYKPVGEAPRPHEVDLSKPDNEDVGFAYNPSFGSGFIIDESSMVTQQIYNDLTRSNRPIIFVGDHGQLPPVQADNVNNFNIMKSPDYRLEKLHRNAGPIAVFAQHLRNGGSPKEYRSDSNKVVITDAQHIPDYELVKSDAILCDTNKNVMVINKHIRTLKKYRERLVVGEKLMVLQNYYPYFFNGESITVDDIYYSTNDFYNICAQSLTLNQMKRLKMITIKLILIVINFITPKQLLAHHIYETKKMNCMKILILFFRVNMAMP